MTSTISFSFNPSQAGVVPGVISWVTTSMAGVNDIPFSWSADTEIYHVNSTAGQTTVDSYVAKNQLRQIQGAISGDYYATGNSLLTWDSNYNHHYYSVWNNSSTANVSTANIPDSGDIAMAYLYWSGWKNNNSMTTVIDDTCDNFSNWTAGGSWSIKSDV